MKWDRSKLDSAVAKMDAASESDPRIEVLRRHGWRGAGGEYTNPDLRNHAVYLFPEGDWEHTGYGYATDHGKGSRSLEVHLSKLERSRL